MHQENDQPVELLWRDDYRALLTKLEAQKESLFFNSFLAVALVVLRGLSQGETLTYNMVIDRIHEGFAPANGWEAIGGFDRQAYTAHFVPMAVEAISSDDVEHVLARLH